ncbi:UrcA family protein [Aurantiacibacter xanthus]|uniref:UrcA family protein n=1 Tax=Aurantiacibacter xanthus TaxID=1784712 RepID=A0A3A1PAH5_9SPHN|nr:UrcA family protein [Aurantiacibacter xanthus]RIV89730.1 UrcA family protein [Aurantiacibacter xanthus]
MKKLTTLALLSTLAFSSAAQAQSAFVMVIGKRTYEQSRPAPAPLTDERRIEIAAERACEKPFIRDLKGQQLYGECLTEARAQAVAQLAAHQSRLAQLSLR